MTAHERPRPDHYEVEVRSPEGAPWTAVGVVRAWNARTPLRFASLRTARDYADRHAARGPRIVLVDDHGGREVARWK